MKNILEVNKVVKKYGDYTALNEVSLSIPQGSIYGLLGPNGAGKTSLIRIINQITMPDSGEVLLDGKLLQPDDVQYIGYMPEERGLYKSMKVGEQCLYLAQLKGLSKEDAKIQLKYWFDRLEIQGWWNKKIQELSKGMAQNSVCCNRFAQTKIAYSRRTVFWIRSCKCQFDKRRNHRTQQTRNFYHFLNTPNGKCRRNV